MSLFFIRYPRNNNYITIQNREIHESLPSKWPESKYAFFTVRNSNNRAFCHQTFGRITMSAYVML